MGRQPAHQRLADLVLGRPVGEFIAEHRSNGLSYRAVADALADATDGAVTVSHEAIRKWECTDSAQNGAA